MRVDSFGNNKGWCLFSLAGLALIGMRWLIFDLDMGSPFVVVVMVSGFTYAAIRNAILWRRFNKQQRELA